MANGYTKINNDLFSGMARLKLTGAGFMVLNAIIRNTLCFHRNQHELSNGFLAQATGLSMRSVIRAIHELEELKIIKITSENCGSHPRKIKIYTDRIVMMTKTVTDSDNPVTINTDRNDSINSDNPVTQEIKEIKEEIKEEERKPSFSSIEEANRWYEEHPEELEDDE